MKNLSWYCSFAIILLLFMLTLDKCTQNRLQKQKVEYDQALQNLNDNQKRQYEFLRDKLIDAMVDIEKLKQECNAK